MQKDAAKPLILSLIDRLESKFDGSTATVEVTVYELAALRALADAEHSQGIARKAPRRADHALVEAQNAPIKNTLIDWSKYEIEPINTHRMCIDFGTAFSKVALVGSGDEIQALAIGKLAGSINAPLTVPSSVLIHKGRLFFGHQAVEKSATSGVLHRRIDGLKQYLSKGDVSKIDEQVLAPEYSDGEEIITEGVVLRMYCAYLTALAEAQVNYSTEGTATPLIGRQVPRRFARPAWDAKKGDAAKTFMEQVLFEGCIIADHFKDRWQDGLEINEVLQFLSALKSQRVTTTKTKLIQDDVLEATAAANAAASGFGDFEGRRLVVVVDTGAGTTDFGAFQVFTHDDAIRIVEITNCRQILRQAGDTLDEAIASMLLQKIGHNPGSDSEKFEKVAINNQRRDLKEALFVNNIVEYNTTDDVLVTLSLDQVLETQPVVTFTKSLKEKFDSCLRGLDPDTVKARGGSVSVVLTGGGANLPMVRALLDPNGAVHRCKQLSVDQDWLSSIDPELPRLFPQLAVAIGGAFPTLPVPIDDVSALAATEAKKWTLNRFQ